MTRSKSPTEEGRPPMNRAWLTLLLLPALATGCSAPKPSPPSPISLAPAVKVVHAQPRTVGRPVEQPGRIEADQRTALYAKGSAFVQTGNVDIRHRRNEGA